ncbi:hypothetical protein BGX26_003695 [Mortierella sp. AD094]|nr:hypothetical protein BGX26_003695 [Mortierella sp. AD094]
MNRDREPTQVIDSSSPPSLTTGEPVGLSKIKATAMLLKQKVAGTNSKPQNVPSKISHRWSLSSSSRSNSFPSPTSPYSNNNGPSTPNNGGFNSSSTTSLGNGTVGTTGTIAGLKKDAIKAMIAAREDPSLSCNKMAPPSIQPVPAPQKRDARAGMTKIQLTPQISTPTPPTPPQETKKREQLDQGEQLPKEAGIDREPQVESQQVQSPRGDDAIVSKSIADSSNTDLGKRSTRRRNAGGEALVPSQFAAPSSSPATPLFMKAFQNPATTAITTTATPVNDTKNTNLPDTQSNNNTEGNDSNVPTKDQKGLSVSVRSAMTSSVTSPTYSLVSPQTAEAESRSRSGRGSSPFKSVAPITPTSATPTTPKASIAQSNTSTLDRRPSTPRRHTTSSSPSLSSSSLFSSHLHDAPPVPHLTQQTMSHVNPTLRQIQTPQIPTNLVQARILQREEQKRRQEELAKIPITANLRTVKKIQAVVLNDDDEDDSNQVKKNIEESTLSSSLSPSIPSGYSSLGPASGSSRPRAKTTTSSTVTVSTLTGGKQRGDRNHVEPVVIPKKLADQVEHILGRKLAGKGSVLDEREKEREEEEARKAAEPLPPIVRGQPRKRAMTSAHIRNLVSSWDHKVEEAKEITTEAEQIRQFLEQRGTAHAELPKFSKVPLTGSELLKPLPSLPPPPPTSGNKVPKRVGGHAKAASSSSPYMSSNHFGSSSRSTPTLQVEVPPVPTMYYFAADTITPTSATTATTTEDVVAAETTPKIVLEILEDDQNVEVSKTTPETSKLSISVCNLVYPI